MSRVITFSRYFPNYHPRKGQSTLFVEKIWASIGKPDQSIIDEFIWPQGWLNQNFDPKHHTIRAGHRWKVGDKFSPRVWSGKPYNSKQIIIAPDIEIKKVWDFDIREDGSYRIDKTVFGLRGIREIAQNDGFADSDDFELWFSPYKNFKGQIISWNDKIDY